MSSLFDLSGRTAVVTGASSGIGRAMAVALAEAGAGVVALGRDEDRLAAVAAQAGARTVCADLGSAEGVAQAVAGVGAAADRVDILVNVAGSNPRPPLDEQAAVDWRSVLAVNLDAPFLLGQAYGPAMAARGWGRIINVGSQQQHRAFGNSGAYGAAKSGLAGLTRSQSEAWGRHGVRVNTVVPGLVETPMTAALLADEERREYFTGRSHVGRIGVPEDFAGIVVFLAGEAVGFVTGAAFCVDGGFSVT